MITFAHALGKSLLEVPLCRSNYYLIRYVSKIIYIKCITKISFLTFITYY